MTVRRRAIGALAGIVALVTACSSALPAGAPAGGGTGATGTGPTGMGPGGDGAGTAGPTPTTGSPSPAGATFTPGPCPFTRTDRNPVRVDCGTVSVPETRSRTSDRRVALAVAVVHATTAAPTPDPIVYLEGGPGGSALSGIEQWTDPPSPLLTSRDVVLIDQRGTGYSQPRLSCDREMAAYERGAERRPAGVEDDAAYRRALTGCHRRLTDGGVDLSSYTTAESATDVDDVRRALGIAAWNLLGVSYGTRLALRVMADHPSGVRSAVLDSVYPATVPSLAGQAPNGAAAFDRLFAGCAADATCASRYPDLRNRFLRTVARLDADPAQVTSVDPDTGEPDPAGGTEPYTGTYLVEDLFDVLYDNQVIPDLPRALDAADRGDLDTTLDLFAGSGIPDPSSGAGTDAGADPGSDEGPGHRPDDTDGLFVTINCAEDVSRATTSAVDDAARAVPDPVRPGLTEAAHAEIDDCRSWPVPPVTDARATTSDIPTLLLSGTLDPITPAAWAEEAARTLSRSRSVVVDGAGHAVIDSGECPINLIARFLADPVATVVPPGAAPACAPTLRFR